MTATFDASSTGIYQTNSSSITDNSLTIGSGSNRALVYAIGFGWSTYSQPTGISVTWDSGGTNQSLSLLVQNVDSTGKRLTQIWGIKAPTSGNKTLSVSWASTVDSVKIAGASFIDVNQAGGSTTFNETATSSNGSVTISTTSNDANFVICNAGGLSSGGGVTIYRNSSGLTDTEIDYTAGGDSDLPKTYNYGGSSGQDCIGVNLNGTLTAPLGSNSTSTHAEFISATFAGTSGTSGGAVSISGLKVGDKLIWLQSPSHLSGNYQMNGLGYFEVSVSVADQLQQIVGTDLSYWTLNAIFLRGTI